MPNIDNLEQFRLERIVTSLYDAGSAASRSILAFAALFAASALVLFATTSGEVKVETLGIDLPRVYASEVLLVLACAALYQHYTLLFAEMMLRKKLEAQLTQAGGSRFDEWFMRYPSSAHFQGVMAPAVQGATLAVAYGTMVLMTWGLFLLPLAMLVTIGRMTNWSAGFAGTAFACVLLLGTTLVMAAQMRPGKVDVALQRLAKHPDSAPFVRATRAITRRTNGWVFLVGGAVLAGTSIVAEGIGWGMAPGIGTLQITAIAIGSVAFASGIILVATAPRRVGKPTSSKVKRLSSPDRRRRLRVRRARPAAT